jgi:hypothetical protein
MKPVQKFIIPIFILSVFCSCKIVIPFTLDRNRIVIYANVNGVDGRYFWDTGWRETITTIPLDNLPHVEYDARRYIKNGIVINGHRLKTTSMITNFSEWPDKRTENIIKEEGFDGILGYYIFNGYWCELSFTESKIILHKNRPDKYALSAGGHISKRGDPCITVNINEDIPTVFVVDTGSPFAFCILNRIIQYIKPAEYKEIFSYIRRSSTSYEIPIQSMSVLNDTFVDKIIRTGEFPGEYEDGLIGVEYLQHYDLLFDIRNNYSTADNYRQWELYYIPRFPDLDMNAQQLYGIKDANPW